jgi:hypothetical protein
VGEVDTVLPGKYGFGMRRDLYKILLPRQDRMSSAASDAATKKVMQNRDKGNKKG